MDRKPVRLAFQQPFEVVEADSGVSGTFFELPAALRRFETALMARP